MSLSSATWNPCGIIKVWLDVIGVFRKRFSLSLEEAEGTRVGAGEPADRLLHQSQQGTTVAGITVSTEETLRGGRLRELCRR